MSWFTLKDQASRSKRKGIWLRFDSPLMKDVQEAVKKSKCKRPSEVVGRVIIHELRLNNEVMLEVWCKSLLDNVRGKQRYNVFYITMKENPDWICEGDLGRGMK